ncbi:MAG: hypothetical protein IKX76_06640, partial [Eubacterium sp.]|nr:hypothetical protein [Eubacterium sp.]
MLHVEVGKKIVSILMVLSLACTTSLTAVQTYAAEKNHVDGEESVDKEETVYVITDGDGQIDEIIVNDKLNNKEGAATIQDETDLSD